MKRALILAACLFVTALPGHAEDFYVAQVSAGGDTGANCANAHALTFFNTAANWSNPKLAGKIGPGDTTHLCGTITSTPTVQASGSSGNPITVLLELNARISQAAAAVLLDMGGQSYILVDGGSTKGIIENTNNGTGLGFQVVSKAIQANSCTGCEFRNLTIQNIYQHTSVSDTTVDQTGVNCVYGNPIGSNTLFHDNVVHDVGWCVLFFYSSGTSGLKIYNNNIFNADHGVAIAGSGNITVGPFYIYGNHIHDFQNWDTTTNAYHHDGIHLYGQNTGGFCPTVSSLYIYNNTFDGDMGANATAWVFLEGGSCASATPWSQGGTAYLFNNTVTTTNSRAVSNGLFSLNGGTAVTVAAYNNDVVNTNPTNSSSVCLSMSATITAKNNVISGCNQLVTIASGSSVTSVNYNTYSNCSGAGSFNCWFWVGVSDTGTFATWKSQSGQDANSQDVASLGLYANFTVQSGSAVIAAGLNLISLGITALNSDLIGVASRPRTASWDAGAYQFPSSVSFSSGVTFATGVKVQ